MYYLFVICATMLQAFDFVLSKKYQAREGTSLSAGLKYNAVNGFFSALCAFCLCAFQVRFSWFSLLMAFAISGCGAIYSILGFRVLKAGNVAVYSVFLMSGGMLLPYIFGILFLHETVSVFRILGVVLILAAVVLSNLSKKALEPKQLALCIAVFLLNGFVSILSKLHQINTVFQPVDSTAFVVYSSGARFIMSFCTLLFLPQKLSVSFTRKHTLWLVIGAAVIGCVSYILQLVGAQHLPATVMYPMVTGGSIVFSAVAGLVFFKEKLSGLQTVSIAAAFLGTLLFL